MVYGFGIQPEIEMVGAHVCSLVHSFYHFSEQRVIARNDREGLLCDILFFLLSHCRILLVRLFSEALRLHNQTPDRPVEKFLWDLLHSLSCHGADHLCRERPSVERVCQMAIGRGSVGNGQPSDKQIRFVQDSHVRHGNTVKHIETGPDRMTPSQIWAPGGC